jgi:hypothetical protein
LNIDEISSFQGFSKDPIQFTKSAWKRIFEELILFLPFELDYRGFIRLILLLDDLNSVPENHQLVMDQHFHIIPHYHHDRSLQHSGNGHDTQGHQKGEGKESLPLSFKEEEKQLKSSSNKGFNPYYKLVNGYNSLKFFWKLLTRGIPSPSSLTTSSGKKGG